MIRRKTSKTVWSTACPAGLFAVAVLALSAGMPFKVHSAENKAAIEASDANMARLVDPILKDAIALYKADKYEQALAKCQQADKVFAQTKHYPSAQVTGQKSMISQLRSEVQAKWGASQMPKIREKYNKADRLYVKNEAEAIRLFNEVIADTNVIITKNPALKAEAKALQDAARKYLQDKLAWGVKSANAVASREKFVNENVMPL